MVSFKDVFQQIHMGNYQEANTMLQQIPMAHRPSEWWRMQALIFVTKGDNAAALNSFERGISLIEQATYDDKTVFYYDYCGFLININRIQDAFRQLNYIHAYAKKCGEMRLSQAASYNYSWAVLQMGKTDEAYEVLHNELKNITSLSQSSLLSLVYCGLSIINLIKGDIKLAYSCAEFAKMLSSTADLAARSIYLQAIIKYAAGQKGQAVAQMADSLAIYSGKDIGHRSQFFLSLWTREIPTARDKEDVCRVLFYEATWALEAGKPEIAREKLMEALPLGNYYTIHQLAMLLPEITEWGRTQGLKLPEKVIAPHIIELKVRGPLLLVINGYTLPTKLPKNLAALLATLILAPEHQAKKTTLLEDALGRDSLPQFSKVLTRLRILVGDVNIIHLEEASGIVSLSSDWKWHLDLQGNGRLLGGIDSYTAQSLELF